MTSDPYSWDEEEEDERPATNVGDPATNLPRVLTEKCATCVLRPGNLMHLAPGRLKEMVEGSIADGTWIICHSTLPSYPDAPERQAICRGFYDNYRKQSWGLRFAEEHGGPIFVELPAKNPQPSPTEKPDDDHPG